MQLRIFLLTLLFMCMFITDAPTYPIDGYGSTNIRRLDYLEING